MQQIIEIPNIQSLLKSLCEQKRFEFEPVRGSNGHFLRLVTDWVLSDTCICKEIWQIFNQTVTLQHYSLRVRATLGDYIFRTKKMMLRFVD